jgi:hypothetical protein
LKGNGRRKSTSSALPASPSVVAGVGKESSKKKRKSQVKESISESEQNDDSDTQLPPPTKRSRSKVKDAGTLSDGGMSADQDSQKEMITIIDTLSSTLAYQIFLEPVSLKEVPDYLEIIPYPMDLSTMKKNVLKGKYSDQQIVEYAVDMRRIGMNCMSYNLPGSSIYHVAEDYLRTFETLYQTTFKSKMKYLKKKTSSKTVDTTGIQIESKNKIISTPSGGGGGGGGTPLKSQSLIDEKKLGQIKKFFKLIYNHHLAEPFLYPVDMNKAPGYSEMIKRPMDLSTIKKNFEYYANSHVNKLIEFYSDLILIFDNCQTYNLDGSELFIAAQELSDYTKQTFMEYFPGVINVLVGKTSEGNKVDHHSMISSSPSSPQQFSNTTSVPMTTSGSNSQLKNSKSNHKKSLSRDNKISLSHSILKSKAGEVTEWGDISLDDKDLNRLSVLELSDFYSFLQSSEEALHSLIIQEKCYYESKKISKNILNHQISDYGSYYSNELYSCASLGTIRTESSWHTKEHIFPFGYICRRDLVLSILMNHQKDEENKNNQNQNQNQNNSQLSSPNQDPLQIPHIQVTFTTEILENENGDPLYRLLVGENILVIESNKIDGIWNIDMFTSYGKLILQSLGQKFRRCRAILFYLSTCDSIEPFLDQQPIFSLKSYLKIIKAPMWLNEVYGRLIDGMYDNEYDFAWDMRLIFQNAMTYNDPNSEVYISAKILLDIFNILFCQWIQNIEDISVFDSAKGLWDEWMTLRYFDRRLLSETAEGQSEEMKSPEKEVCYLTGLSNSEDVALLFCISCENFCHPSVSDGGSTYEETNDEGVTQQLWRCQRCQRMKVALESNQYSGLLPEKRYQKTKIFKSYLYKPANDLGSGWVKATTSTKPLVGKFLSPLGYQFNTKEEALSWMNEELQMHEKLIADREEEFLMKQGNSSHVGRKKKVKNAATAASQRGTRGRKRKQIEADEPVTNDSESLAKEGDDASTNNSMVMLMGKLLQIPYEEKGVEVLFSGLYEAPGTQELKMTIFNMENISPTGFSGLDDPIIHRLIEGLPGSNYCRKYRFLDCEQILENYLQTVRIVKEKKDQLSSADHLLIEKQLYERNYWKKLELETRKLYKTDEKMEQNPSSSLSSSSSEIPIEKKFPKFEKNICQLLIPLIPTEWKLEATCDEIEIAVHVWEFLHHLTPLISYQTFGLLDIIKSLTETNTFIFPNPSSIIFDELCCLLSSILLNDISQILYPSSSSSQDKETEFHKQEFLSFHPLNSVTWPWITYTILLFSTTIRGGGGAGGGYGQKLYCHDEIMKIIHLDNYFKNNYLLIREFIYLFLSYPLFHKLTRTQQQQRFMLGISSSSYENNLYSELYLKIMNMIPSNYEERKQMKNEMKMELPDRGGGDSDSDSESDSEDEFCENQDLFQFFENLFLLLQESDDQDLIQWFCQLLQGYIDNSCFPSSGLSDEITEELLTNCSSTSSTLLNRPTHENLAISLRTLRMKEPDCFTLTEKVTILHTLIQYCSVTDILSSHHQRMRMELAQSPFSDDPDLISTVLTSLETEIQAVEVTKANKSSLKCYFSGLEGKLDPTTLASFIDEDAEWVTVPQSILTPPVMRGELTNIGNDIDDVQHIESEPTGTEGLKEVKKNPEEHSESEAHVEEENEAPQDTKDDEIPVLKIRKRGRKSTKDTVTLKLQMKPKVCLKSNLVKVVAARELAAQELELMEVCSPLSLSSPLIKYPLTLTVK